VQRRFLRCKLFGVGGRSVRGEVRRFLGSSVLERVKPSFHQRFAAELGEFSDRNKIRRDVGEREAFLPHWRVAAQGVDIVADEELICVVAEVLRNVDGRRTLLRWSWRPRRLCGLL
jgi:hypothetical protein